MWYLVATQKVPVLILPTKQHISIEIVQCTCIYPLSTTTKPDLITMYYIYQLQLVHNNLLKMVVRQTLSYWI